MRHDHRVEGAIEFFLPKGEEILECREFRKQIVILPDIGLQQRGMIRHPIEDLCRGQPLPQDLLPTILGNHAKLHSLHAAPFQQIVFAVAVFHPAYRSQSPRSSVMAITDQGLCGRLLHSLITRSRHRALTVTSQAFLKAPDCFDLPN